MAAPDLGKMYGPLPLGAWLGVVGGGIAFAVYARKRASGAAPAPAADAATGAGLPIDPTYTANPSDGGAGAGYTSNEAWQRATEIALIAKGYDPVLVDRALRDYLAGNQLDAAEGAIESEALRISGPPPNPPGSTPPPLPIPQPPAGPGAGTQHGKTVGAPYGFPGTNAHAVVTVLRHDGQGGYELDSWGGIHPFATAGSRTPPKPIGGPYWPGQNHAVGMVLNGNDTAGYVLDDLGANHPFTIPKMITSDGNPSR